MAIVWLNGELLEETEARIPVLDRGVLWGYGLFETMRAYGGRVWALDEHHERLCHGGERLDHPVPDKETLRTGAHEVLKANALSDAGVRATVTRGTGPPDPHAEPTGAPNVVIAAWPLADYTELYEQGAKLITLTGGGRPLAGIKTTSYAASVAGRVFARRGGADDALFIGDDGRVLEATGSNLFAISGDRLTTPPIDEAILPGVTRRHVLDVARSAGFETIEEPLSLDELFEADEVVLTSSLREVYPVQSIDGRTLNRRTHAERLRAAYEAFVTQRVSTG